MGALGAKINVGASKISNKIVMDGTKMLAENGMAVAGKTVTEAVAKGTSTVIKKAVGSGLKFAGKTATEALAEGAEKVVEKSARTNSVSKALETAGHTAMDVVEQASSLTSVPLNSKHSN